MPSSNPLINLYFLTIGSARSKNKVVIILESFVLTEKFIFLSLGKSPSRFPSTNLCFLNIKFPDKFLKINSLSKSIFFMLKINSKSSSK